MDTTLNKTKKFKTKLITKSELPLVIEPSNENITMEQFAELIREENDYLKKQMLKHGGILFRGFPVKSEHDFSTVIKSMGTGEFINYIGGDSPRTKIIDGIYTSTEAPPSVKLPLHNELSYVKYYPSHIYFYCNIAPTKDGETTIADARKIYDLIDKDVKNRFLEKDLKYVSRYFHRSPLMEFINKFQKGHKTWIDVFETDDKSEVARKCKENEFTLKWNQNDWLQISHIRPSITTHPETGETVWFNQAHHFDFNPKLLGFWRYLGAQILYCREHMRLHEVFFSDNSPIPREDLYHILDVLEENTIYFPWQQNDVLVLDNVLSMHGRNTFNCKRRILTAMTGKK